MHSTLGLLSLGVEPPSGFFVRIRCLDHHTACEVYHRDDAEGHDDGRVWWSHDSQQWVSWYVIVDWVEQRPEERVIEPLFALPKLPGCAPDGPHTDKCLNPDPAQFK